MDATEHDVTELRETTTTMNTNIHSINDTLTAINNQLQQMRRDFTAMDSRLTAMDSRIDARFNRIDARFNQVNSDLTTMAEDNNTRFERTNSQLVGLGTRIDSHFAGVDKAFDKQNIRMMALHNNAMSRLDNRLPGASSDNLEPLFNLDTGEKIQENPTRARLGSMSYSDSCGDRKLFARAGNYPRRVKGREAESAETGIRYEDIRLSWVRGSD
ncbi:hypothetical protein E4U38_002854 [Claviceps purpurea]|nr:hypothetical protein E4U38_002854 [Claviceps purpurea]